MQIEEDETAKILVVDDRPENLLVCRTTLEELRQEIITVNSGEEALKCLLENEVAVILLDVNMPGMDGFETTRYIRMHPRTAHTPIIFLTAYIEEMHTFKGYSLGAVDFILTPVVPEILRTKVKVFVQLYLMNRRTQRLGEARIALEREKAARAIAEDTIKRSAFLADTSQTLSNSLDAGETIAGLTKQIVPVLGDFCAVTVLEDGGQRRKTEPAWFHSRGDTAGNIRSMDDLDSPITRKAIDDALAKGTPVLIPESDIDSGKDVHYLHAGAVWPLIARGRTLGALMAGFVSSERSYDTATLMLGNELATRAAISIDNCQLYAKLQESDQRKNEFLAMLAHELRNPLASVRNAVQILRLKRDGKGGQAVDIIDRQTKQLVSLIEDLIDVARVTQGKIELKLEAVDVGTIVGLAIEMNRLLIDKQGHKLTITVPTSPLFVYGDATRIAQVLSNLINNAIKYTKSEGKVSLTVEESSQEILFRIQDNGIGIPQEMLGSIFDLFTQGHHSLDRSEGGLGVGLTIVQRLVNLQHGSVEVFSEGPNKGSQFVVRLPRAAMPCPAEADDAGEIDLNSHRALVVDDTADAADSMAALLQLMGQEVRVARDGESALQLARDFQPDVIFLDIGLPGMNGYEVARALREFPETHNCLIVAVSGYGQDADRRQSREAGFDKHLVKPAALRDLRDILNSLEYTQPVITDNDLAA